ncbi:POZ-, AT hook-, and zinc finger-containing protein 1 isoform X1 [Triplophysa dalaica]|uniref:POZ-, AT hook-, and zinc finger-containing protein 1 isoform X1 n=1 Tax=Triplophysa dalaica TaxID=1582913 RepID=UPI0024E00E25|nr:POZ-, AT hook-, and zinc finger-containing protein 1 isoform X1 [Triplophysa dalaica]
MERTDQPWSSSYTYQVSKHSAEMLHNLNTQRKDGGRFCDVILRVGEESFPAHKAVLAACSEYFEAVFSCQAVDGGEGKELEMHTISPKVFRDILDFAYTSKIVVRLECFPELMTAAKFLLMRSVIEICQEVIKQSNVQILVPPSRGGEHSLFRSPGAAEQLSHPVDMSNGSVSNGAVFTNNNDSDSADPRRANNSSQPAVPEADDRLPVSPLEFPSNHLNSEGSPGSKRGRGRPKKESASEPITFNSAAHNENNQLFPCGVCGKVCPDEVQLRNHETQHGTFSGGVSSGVDLVAVNGPTLVSQSQARFQQNGLPADSRKRERTRRHVACDLCGKVFRDVYHLNRHKLSHSGEKPYACPVCGLRFKRKDRMSYHVRSHDGSVGKPYVCQSCGKGFSRPDHLNGHIKQVHTTERPHKCQICNASFATRDRLRSHLACHEDKIPCQVCGKFLRAAYMTDHLKKHSEGPHNFCGICNKGFSTASYLKVHVKTHHSSSVLPSSAAHQFPEPRTNRLQMHNGAPYHSGRPCAVEDLCTSRRLLVTFPETEGSFRGISGPVLPQPVPPALSLQPELLLGKPGPTPYFWECRSSGAHGFPLHGPLTDGQENAGKCPHQDSDGSDAVFGDLPNGTDLKPEEKPTGEDLEVTSFIFNGQSDNAVTTPGGSKLKMDPEKKFACAECGQTFRTKSYLNKHHHRVHKKRAAAGSNLGNLGSPFSPQQNMSLLESFGFQIVQSAFASSLVDSEMGGSGIDLGDK